MALFQNILLPLDVADQANAERAIDAARLIAIASGGDVHLLHVRLFLPMTYTRFLPPGFDAAEQSDCDAALALWTDRLGLPEQRVTRTLRRGAVPVEVLNEAEKRGTDLIIIGSHMPTLASRMMGSNASAIVRDAEINVLIVRADEHKTT